MPSSLGNRICREQLSWVQRCSIQPLPWFPSNNLALGTVAQAACSLGCPTPSLGIPGEAARGAGAWATKQPPEYPLCTCFSLSAGEPSLRDTARVPELPRPTEKPVTKRQNERMCVCAEEGMVCHLRVHASVYTLVILNANWAGGVSRSSLSLGLLPHLQTQD